MLKQSKIFANICNLTSLLLIALLCCNSANSQEPAYADNVQNSGLYEYVDNSHPLLKLNYGNSEFESLQLDKPISFFSEKYENIYINTNGILTFDTKFPEYVNQPFPLEYASIAVFYSNVDTSANNETTAIKIFLSEDPQQLHEASSLVRYAFTEQADFQANRIIVASWENVGYFQAKTDMLNTFQAIIITNDENTFVQFVYPENGLNWLQGETSELDLPDIRPQVGFISEYGLDFNLEGSATENVKYLAKSSNVGRNGIWLYQVGALNINDNVRAPTNPQIPQERTQKLWTCAQATQGYCNSHAQCYDKSDGFCCVCQQGYYGNGKSCIKNDVVMRVTGSLHGEINGEIIGDRTKMQTYIFSADALIYTAVNPVAIDLGTNLRLALPLVSTVGWLFAKPVNGALNGYQLTGGVFRQVSKLHFSTGELLTINQTFEGLNYWDQLTADIEIFGQVPRIAYGSKLKMNDFIDEYKFQAPGSLRSVHAHSIEITDEQRMINFQLDQTIEFERCLLDGDADPSGTSVLQKASKIKLDYSESDQAVRTGMINEIGVNAESNVCSDSLSICGANKVCVPYEDTYRCDCLHGYAPQLNQNGEEVCLDIDECVDGSHLCDENAYCTNTEGGFACACREGFLGSGHKCIINSSADNMETPGQIINVETGTEQPEYAQTTISYNQESNCYHCSPNADCVEGRCICHEGFYGNGYECVGQPVQLDVYETEPHCDIMLNCRCPEGYSLNSDGRICIYDGNYNRADDAVSCDASDNCHHHAVCQWYEQEMRHICVCNPGYQGNGLQCEIIDESCAIKPDICDLHATCMYNDELGKSACVCNRGYEGDGFSCSLGPECVQNQDCGLTAWCDRGSCQCNVGFERDMSDNCVQAGSCGSVFCGANAICKWDEEQRVQYCDCMDGYEGNALEGCQSIPMSCNVRNNCGMHAICEPTEDPARYECHCASGYSGDGYNCVEIPNCLNNPHLCDMNAHCSSTNTGLVCVCNAGFYGNGSVCHERQRHDAGFLLVSQGVMIVRVPLNGAGVLPISITSMAIDLDKDCVAGRVYWGDISSKKIESSYYNGTDEALFISDGVESPEGIAIDASSRRIYWTDSEKDTVEVASLDAPELRTVLINKDLVNPRGIAVDPFKEKLYWSDWNREAPKIEMSNLDGTEREILLGKESVKLPNSLVVLENSGELCFADAGTKKIQCIDPYTRNLRTISEHLHYPFGVTYLQNNFYSTDWITKKLETMNAVGGNQKSMQIPLYGSHKMFGLTAIDDICPQFESPCQINNGGCPDNRLCLVNRSAPSGKSCKCTALSQNCNIPRYGGQF